MRSGLISGDFSPPHAGHHYLIDTARAQVDALTVLVRDTPGQPIPAALRARWLRETHPDVAVAVLGAAGSDGGSSDWAAAVVALIGARPDVVLSSGAAGADDARRLGCEHVSVDPGHQTFPIASARVRADPIGARQWLQPNVRAYFVRRVCAIGSESTGKTVLCERLAARYDAPWVAEYGREYTLLKLRTAHAERWEAAEFVHIAREQQRREDEAARRAGGLVVCDTDAFATEIWLERYLGPQPAAGWPVRDRPMDLYLLTDPNVPFVPDAIRDGERFRRWMFERFRAELERRGFPYIVLAGSYDERERRAVAATHSLLAAPAALSGPTS